MAQLEKKLQQELAAVAVAQASVNNSSGDATLSAADSQHAMSTLNNPDFVNKLPNILRAGSIYQPSVDGMSYSLLILLHGLGDTPIPYAGEQCLGFRVQG